MLSGNFDVAEAISYAAARQLGSSANAQLIRLPNTTSLVAVMDTTQAPFTDNRVRQAFKLAVDRQAVLNTVFAGFGVVTSDLMMAPTDPYYLDDLKSVSYDPDQAKSLLAAAGYPGGGWTSICGRTEHTRRWRWPTLTPLKLRESGRTCARAIRIPIGT